MRWMAVMARQDPAETGHLVGDVPALLLVAVALGILMRRAETERVITGLSARRAA
jgi:hypothetical protein